MRDPAALVVAEEAPSAAPPGRTARLILDLGFVTDEAAALARDLVDGVLDQIEAMLTDSAIDLSAELRGALAALAGALAEQTAARGHRPHVEHAAGARLARPSRRVRAVRKFA